MPYDSCNLNIIKLVHYVTYIYYEIIFSYFATTIRLFVLEPFLALIPLCIIEKLSHIKRSFFFHECLYTLSEVVENDIKNFIKSSEVFLSISYI